MLLDVYSIWPSLIIVALMVGLAATPLLRPAEMPPGSSGGRLMTLDGLRGFLALGVVFHHVAISHRYMVDKVWTLPPSRFYTDIGQVGVSLFFMITGFLFWSRLIVRQGRMDWFAFYIGRVFRIGPLYLATIGIMLLFIFMRSHWTLMVSPETFCSQLWPWLELGFSDTGPINGEPLPGLILAGVTWTLHYEWWFYACLIPAALFSRHQSSHLPFALVILAGALVQLLSPVRAVVLWPQVFAMFGCGMVSASLHALRNQPVWSDRRRSIVAAALLISIPVLYDGAYDAVPILIMGAAFYLISGGCSLFGLLTSGPARRLGDISFSIYLLQGPVLLATFRIFPLLEARSAAGHWAVALVAVTALILISTASYALIERPGMRVGRALIGLHPARWFGMQVA